MATLNGIELPRNLVWGDRFDYCPIKQTTSKTVTGHVVIQRGRMVEGRPITLTGAKQSAWLKQSEADALAALRLLDDPLTLVYAGDTFKVRFNLSDANHLPIRPVLDGCPVDDPDALCYVERIALIEVLS